MVSATPDLRLPSQPKLVLIGPTHEGGGQAELTWVAGYKLGVLSGGLLSDVVPRC